MLLHDFLSKCLMPLQDGPRPAWMYTEVNDIIRLDRRSGSSLDEDLLVVSLKALTMDQFSAELVVLPAACEPICTNQAVRTTLLAAMPTLDDVDIAPVWRGDLSHGVVILGAGGLGGTVGGRGPVRGRGGISIDGRGGGPVGGGRGGSPAGGCGDVLASSRGSDPDGGSSPAPTPGKGKDKQVRVVLDDDEVSFDKDAPL
jgi:hypothetical protein